MTFFPVSREQFPPRCEMAHLYAATDRFCRVPSLSGDTGAQFSDVSCDSSCGSVCHLSCAKGLSGRSAAVCLREPDGCADVAGNGTMEPTGRIHMRIGGSTNKTCKEDGCGRNSRCRISSRWMTVENSFPS